MNYFFKNLETKILNCPFCEEKMVWNNQFCIFDHEDKSDCLFEIHFWSSHNDFSGSTFSDFSKTPEEVIRKEKLKAFQ
jgi:hypothetical protein